MSQVEAPNASGRSEMSPNLRDSLQRAIASAFEQSHRHVTLEHLLLAFVDDREAAIILETSTVDTLSLKTDVSNYLGRLDDRTPPGAPKQPALGSDVQHIIQSAGAAAQKSRRRAVSSALVLAAIVGDGRSPGAQILRNLGLTFENAIAALKQVNTAAAQTMPPAAAQTATRTNGSPQPVPAAPSPKPPTPQPPVSATDATASEPRLQNMQAAHDIIASARQRIAAARGTIAAKRSVEMPTRETEATVTPALAPVTESAPAAPLHPASTSTSAREDVAPVAGEKAGQIAEVTSAEPQSRPTTMPTEASAEKQVQATEPVTAPPVRPQSTPMNEVSAETPIIPNSIPARPASPPQPPVQQAPQPSALNGQAATAVSALPTTEATAPPAEKPQAPAPQRNVSPAPPLPMRGVATAPAAYQQPQPSPPAPASSHHSAEHNPGPPTVASQLQQAPQPPAFRPTSGQSAPGQSVQPQPHRTGDMVLRHPSQVTVPPRQMPPNSSYPPALTQSVQMRGRPDASDAEFDTPAALRAPIQSPTHAGAPSSNVTPIEPEKLIESIPGRMRVGVPTTVEIRAPRARLEAWSSTGQDQRNNQVITKAMVMRLRAPDGGFTIEIASPETQWSEGAPGPLSDDDVSWRWTITPTRRGRNALQLCASTRVVGRDGLAAARSLPEQVASVRVSPNYTRFAGQLGIWIAIACVAGAFGYFAEGLFSMGTSMLAQVIQ